MCFTGNAADSLGVPTDIKRSDLYWYTQKSGFTLALALSRETGGRRGWRCATVSHGFLALLKKMKKGGRLVECGISTPGLIMNQ